MKNKIVEIDFYELCEQYEKNLNIQLRDFGSEYEYLKFWVPDTDLKKSFCNLIEALKEIKYFNFKVFFNSKKNFVIDENFLTSIEKNVGKINVLKKSGDLYANINIDIEKYDNNFKIFLPSSHKKTMIRKFEKIQNTQKVAIEDIHKDYLKKINQFKKIKLDYCFFDHENEIQNYLNNKSNIFFSHKDGIFELKLIINQSDHTIIKCYHNLKNINHNSILINFFCNYLKGLHIQEAADHAVIYLEHYFRPSNTNHLKGIILPDQAGTSFKSINIIIRKILEFYRKINNYKDTTNRFYTKIGQSWKNLSDKEKQSKIENIILDFNKKNQIPNDQLKFIAIDKSIRVYVQVDNKINQNQNQLMHLENSLKKFEKRLEIFTTEIKDSNKLRWKNAPKSDTVLKNN